MIKAVKHNDFERVPLKNRQQDAMKTLVRWLEILQKSWIKYSIWCWTMLWLYRDWKFIDCDLDVDINIIMDWNKFDKFDEFNLLKLFDNWKLIRTMHHEDKPCQIAFMSEFNVIFDLTFYYTGIKEWKVISYSDVGIVSEDASLFGWLIPSPCDKYLEQRYWDWRTPASEFAPWNTYCKSIVKW